MIYLHSSTCSIIFLSMRMLSMHSWSVLNPFCILSGTDIKVMPHKLLKSLWFPFCGRFIIIPSIHWVGIVSFSIFFSFNKSGRMFTLRFMPPLSSSASMPSALGFLLFLSFLMVVLISLLVADLSLTCQLRFLVLDYFTPVQIVSHNSIHVYGHLYLLC